jgi:hypothetical protein
MKKHLPTPAAVVTLSVLAVFAAVFLSSGMGQPVKDGGFVCPARNRVPCG